VASAIPSSFKDQDLIWFGRSFRWAPALVSAVFMNCGGASRADDIQLLYPDNNVSHKAIIVFRARGFNLSKHSPGHAFVLIGSELDNGLKVFSAAGGFYPIKGGKVTTIKTILSVPGKVT